MLTLSWLGSNWKFWPLWLSCFRVFRYFQVFSSPLFRIASLLLVNYWVFCGKGGAKCQDYTDGWILLWLCGLKGGWSHQSLLSETLCSPSCLSILSLFKQRDYREESSKASRKGLFNSSKGIKGESCIATTATDPRGPRLQADQFLRV